MDRADQNSQSEQRMSRRQFLGAGALGGAALLAGGWSALVEKATASTAGRAGGYPGPWFEASIPQLQSLIAKGKLSSSELTRLYLNQIAGLNPLLHAIIETNPDALAIAAQLDDERRKGQVRGPLHGIPIVVKDNIATDDQMETTAGSLALVGSRIPTDALIVRRLREAGAIILGKANLSEWANFRGFPPFNGWSARGGFTRNPYVLSADPSGSSSGSAVASAVNMCAAAVGTETDGSIVNPSANNLIVGIKPTIGLVPQDGIIPIAHSQDTAGPMARTVTDAAILLAVLAGNPAGYTAALKPGALRGARIGVDRQYFSGAYGTGSVAASPFEKALSVMQNLGAVLVDTKSGNLPNDNFVSELTALLCEFKDQIAEYLAGLHNTSMRTLADLIKFNQDHCTEEMKYFGQDLFKSAEKTGGLSDPKYQPAREKIAKLARTEGIDAALSRDRLDAIVAPNGTGAESPPAVAGYPNISVPIGLAKSGRPASIYIYGDRLQEQKLLGYAYDLEQALKPRRVPPQYLNAVPREPADVGICATPAAKAVDQDDLDTSGYHTGRQGGLCL